MNVRAQVSAVLLIPLLAFAQSHLLISEVLISPTGQQFIEIYNPNPFPVALDNYYLTDYNTYYRMVENVFSTDPGQFLIKFPDGAQVDSAGMVVVALDGSTFNLGAADWEILGNSASVPDMVPLYVGSSASLGVFDLVMLFYWDGQSDLVQDVDYLTWGSFTTIRVDKSGVSIDGPDPDTTPSTYLNDTPQGNQLFVLVAPSSNQSLERINYFETGETQEGGNGIAGHDETSEPLRDNFDAQVNPNPGTGPGLVGAPVFEQLSFRPTLPTVADTVTVEAEIVDNGQVVSTKLFVSINAMLDSMEMSRVSETRFTGTILPQPAGTTVRFYVRARDDQGMVSFSDTLSYVVRDTTGGAAHLLISEIAVSPSDGEFVEIFNPTSQTIDLSNYYLTDATFAGGNTYYYNIVTGSNAGGGDFGDFHARFPEGATIAPGEFQTIAMNGSGFVSTYQLQPTYELYDTDPSIPDMREALPGSINGQGGLTNSGEVVILYFWDGQSDLVQDVDYVVWGDKAEAVDKTGVSIDGPDPDTTPSTYLDDTPIDQQISVSSAEPHLVGESIQRVSLIEHGEKLVGGNGITGHDETSEDLATSFPVDTPNPGSGPALSGAPVIGQVSQTPEVPGPGEPVTVTAEVTDDGQVETVRLIYTINGQADSTAMTTLGADQYQGTIPGQPEGTQVSYFVRAIDNQGLQSTSRQFTYTVVSTTPGGLHLLITEIAVTPTDGEFIEIHNPTDKIIDLSNYYLTDATFAPNNTFYYNIVTGSNAGGGDFGDFHARFPEGATIAPGEFQTIALNGTGFTATYQVKPTYELWDTDPSVPDMREALPGSINNQGSLTNSGEVVILYFWDGQSDLVQDVDYVVWGDKAEAVDKTGVSIDGPDPDSTPSTYLSDTPISEQISVSSAEPHAMGESIQRTVLVEIGEREFGGNGVTGHDETSEELSASFVAAPPNPGNGPVVTGLADGSGLASLPFASLPGDTTLDVPILLVGTALKPVRSIQVDLPLFWDWSADLADLLLQGRALQQAQADIRLTDGVVSIQITGANLEQGDTATVVLKAATTPQDSIRSLFWIQTAGEGGKLKFISHSPEVAINQGVRYLIYDLQTNSANFTDRVLVRGVTTIGSGLLRKFSSSGDSLTTAYIQDESGRGINLFRFGVIDPLLQRNNRVEVSGFVTEFNLVTEIEYDQIRLLEENATPPDPVVLSTREVNSPKWDGTLIQTRGVVVDKFSAGGGTTLIISDGQGTTNVRVWDTAELDLQDIKENVAIIVEGVGGVFVSSRNDTIYQVLPAYQDQIRVDPTYQPSLSDAGLEVDPFPFVPDQGERIRIRFNAAAVNNHVTIRIFDLGGRLVKTLVDEDAQLFQRTVFWDGRNDLLERVPVGTYICHMEVQEPRTGARRTFRAPIVVGTLLNR